MHVLRQLEKTIFRPATRCNHKEIRIRPHGTSASDAPMPTTRCPKSARRAQAVSVEIGVPPSSGEGACELVLLQDAPPKVRHNNRRGRYHIAQNPAIRRVRLQLSRQCVGWGGGSASERRGLRPTDMAIFTLSGQLAPSWGLFCYQNAYCSPSCPRPRVTVDA